MVLIVKGVPRVDAELKPNAVLWRYLDAAKFLDLVHSGSLFFSRGDQFNDKFEGAFTKSLRTAIDEAYAVSKIDSNSEEFRDLVRQNVFLNCWRAGLDDSMAMWSIYGRSPTSLAITTTVGKLRDSIAKAKIHHNVAVKKVRYIKHWRNPKIDIVPYSNIFAYKLRAYDFENEVRVIIDRLGEKGTPSVNPMGISVKISLNSLLRSIVVSPEAPIWFVSLVEEIALSYGLKAPVRRSKLSFSPP